MSGALAAAFGNRFGGRPNYSPSSSLITPTFEGSGETTEPTWIAKPSWVTAAGTDLLAHNPLPGGDDDYENPCLLISNDHGDTWAPVPGMTNPIAPKPTAIGLPGNNADCFLFADPFANRLIMFWLVTADPDESGGINHNGFWYSVCTDPALVTWSARALLFNLNGVGAQIMLPSEQESKFLWDHVRGRYVMFTQDNTTNVLRIRVSTGTDVLGTYGAPVVCSLPIPGGDAIWHMDIIQEASGRFVMIMCDSHVGPGGLARQAWLASSADGIHWKVAPRPLMHADDEWAITGLYRPSIIPARAGGHGFDVIVARAQSPSARFGLVRNIPATEIP